MFIGHIHSTYYTTMLKKCPKTAIERMLFGLQVHTECYSNIWEQIYNLYIHKTSSLHTLRIIYDFFSQTPYLILHGIMGGDKKSCINLKQDACLW